MAVQFDRNLGQALSTSDAALLGTGTGATESIFDLNFLNMTFMAWIYRQDQGGSFRRFVEVGAFLNSGGGFAFLDTASPLNSQGETIVYGAGDNQFINDWIVYSAPPANTWAHYCVAATPLFGAMYINGLNVGVNTYPPGYRGSGVPVKLSVAGEVVDQNQEFATCRVAEIAVYDVTLSGVEVERLATRRLSPLLVRPEALRFYAPLFFGPDPYPDLMGHAKLGQQNNPTSAPHPPITYPSNRSTSTAGVVAPVLVDQFWPSLQPHDSNIVEPHMSPDVIGY